MVLTEVDNKKIKVGEYFNGKKPNLVFFHKSDLNYSDKTTKKQKVGEVKIYSTGQVVLDRIKYGFFLLIGTALVKTIL